MKRRIVLATTVFFGAVGFFSTAASAQATRTWVSGVGDDVNPCSRTAPCKTFSGAISKTAPGGEINCLDPGGFGAVTIIKAMTINCIYTEGGVLAGGNGITVNAQPTDVVFLRGLDIFGVNPPTHGVRFIAGGELHIEDSTIRRFNAANSFGVSFQPSGSSRLFITRTTIATNGNAGTGGGILIQPTGASGNARAVIHDVEVSGNANVAISVNTTGATSASGVIVDITNSRISGSTNGISALSAVGTSAVSVNVRNSEIFNHQPGSGIVANGGVVLVRASGNMITANGAALSISNGASIRSYGDNLIEGNSNVSAFTLPNLNPE